MRRYRDLGLAAKLSLLLLLVLGLLLLATIVLLSLNTQTLTQEVGSERLGEEVNILQSQLTQLEGELDVDINFLVSSVTFFQAVGSRDTKGVSDIISRTNLSRDFYDVVVVDGDGKRLVDTQGGADTNAEDTLLAAALRKTKATTVFAEENNGETRVSIAAAAPVVSITGNVLGAIQISRQIDTAFLSDLTFKRSQVYAGLIYGDQILARNTTLNDEASAKNSLVSNIPFDPALVKLAQSGQSVISDTLIYGGGVPYAVAYLPVAPAGSSSPAVLMVLVQLSDISSFQNTTLLNTIIVFIALTVLTIVLIYLTLYRIAIRPIDTVRTIAQKMIGGQYDQRIPITSHDELGQLASTFNEMAGAVQQRETGLHKAREDAERADRAKSAFLASMSHELRTPLNSIINFTSFVLEGDTGPITEEQADLLNEVVKGSRHLLNLINDVLDMSKIEAGSLRLFIEDDISLNTILKRIVTTGRSLLAEKPVQLLFEADEAALPLIRGDQQRILQIFLNIMSNACKFTEQGQITVRAEHRAGEIIIAIADTGPGIPVEDRDLIFQVFTQTTTGIKKGGGTGLGMPIAKSLAEAHGGRLWFESEPGVTTTFYVALPVKSEILVPTLER